MIARAPPGDASPKSVTGRFRAVLLLVFGAGTILATALAWQFAGSAADEAYDRLLQSAAVQLLDGVRTSNGIITALPPESAFDTLALADEDRSFYAVRGHGMLLTGYPDLPAATGGAHGGVADAAFRDAAVRLVTVRRAAGPDGRSGTVEVTVAQTREARGAMQLRLFLRQAPIALLLGLIGLAGSLFAARLAIRPLAQLEAAIAVREPRDLSPISMRGPRETQALVSAIDELLARLGARLEKLQAFAGLVAHQLRTPLAALGSQLDLLANEQGAEGGARVERLRSRLAELNRLVHQLLGHAMIAYRGESAPRHRVDLVEVARAVAMEIAADPPPGATIAFEAGIEPAFVLGEAVLLREATTNLVDNAMRHGSPTPVRIGVAPRAGMIALTVVDDGPGIARPRRDAVLEPFGSKGSSGEGAGLGLSIAAEAARMHGGTIAFRGGDGTPFEVAMLIPAAA